MDAFNDFFTDLGGKMPFATDFFSSELSIAGGKISTFFLVLLAALVTLIAIVISAVCISKLAKNKKASAKATTVQTNTGASSSAKGNDVLEAVKVEDNDDIMQGITPLSSISESGESQARESAAAEPDAQEVAARPAGTSGQTDETAQPRETDGAPATEQSDQEAVEPPAETTSQEVADQPAEALSQTDEAAQPASAQPEQEITEQPAEATSQEVPAQRPDAAVTETAAQEVAAEQALADTPSSQSQDTPANDKNSDAPVVATEVTDMKKEEDKKATAKVQEEKKAKKALIGTFEVSLCLDGYRFCLYASNKQLMYESVGFTSSEGAMKGIETFRKTLQECPYIITRDKYGRFRYVVNKRYQGENYTSAASAQSAAESVKRWAENAKVIVRNPKPEEIDAYKKGLESLRTKDDVDWDQIEKEEKAERKMGKFTVEEDGNQDEVIGYRFYLIANNAQILYTSAIYTSASGALKAIDTFKRAVYIGNFYVDEDKFGHFRYILRSNATTTYVGESYKTRASAESSIDSVKKFVKCATIVPFKKGAASDEN